MNENVEWWAWGGSELLPLQQSEAVAQRNAAGENTDLKKASLHQQKQNQKKNVYMCEWKAVSFKSTANHVTQRHQSLLEGLSDEAVTRTTVRLVSDGRKQTRNVKWRMDHFLWVADAFCSHSSNLAIQRSKNNVLQTFFLKKNPGISGDSSFF